MISVAKGERSEMMHRIKLQMLTNRPFLLVASLVVKATNAGDVFSNIKANNVRNRCKSNTVHTLSRNR